MRWSLLAPRAVTTALWSPSGFRVAYRSGQRPARGRRRRHGRPPARPRRVPARWRGGPAPAHVLAYLSGAHIDIVDVDSGRRLARIRLPHVPHELAWSADGRRALRQPPPLAGDLRRARPPHRPHLDARPPDDLRPSPPRAAAARGGRARARARASSEVALMAPARAAAGAVRRRRAASPACASRPSGRWLLVAWPLADQWVFLRPGATGARRVLAAPRRDAAHRLARLPAAQRLVLPAVSLWFASVAAAALIAGARAAAARVRGAVPERRVGRPGGRLRAREPAGRRRWRSIPATAATRDYPARYIASIRDNLCATCARSRGGDLTRRDAAPALAPARGCGAPPTTATRPSGPPRRSGRATA